METLRDKKVEWNKSWQYLEQMRKKVMRTGLNHVKTHMY